MVTQPKNFLDQSIGFGCYSTLRRWVYAKCRPALFTLSHFST